MNAGGLRGRGPARGPVPTNRTREVNEEHGSAPRNGVLSPGRDDAPVPAVAARPRAGGRPRRLPPPVGLRPRPRRRPAAAPDPAGREDDYRALRRRMENRHGLTPQLMFATRGPIRRVGRAARLRGLVARCGIDHRGLLSIHQWSAASRRHHLLFPCGGTGPRAPSQYADPPALCPPAIPKARPTAGRWDESAGVVRSGRESTTRPERGFGPAVAISPFGERIR